MIKTMHYQEPPVTREQIENVATDLGCAFPKEYIEFLLTYNGGVPEPDDFPISKKSGSLVGEFLGVTDGQGRKKASDIFWTNKLNREHIPRGFIAFARDQGGNFLCLGVEGIDRGKVFFLDHEETVGQPLKERFWKIADDLARFLDSLGWRSGTVVPPAAA